VISSKEKIGIEFFQPLELSACIGLRVRPHSFPDHFTSMELCRSVQLSSGNSSVGLTMT
jgi:hypothetical protein